MFKNHLKIAWRTLLKHRGLFAINIVGLGLGIASCLLMMLYVVDELSYDRFNKKADEIVRVVFRAKINGEEIKEAVVMPPVGKTLASEFPEVLQTTRIRNIGNQKVSYQNTTYRNSRLAHVDPNFFEIFTLPVIKGNAVSPLKEPNTIVLTRKEAERYFGSVDAAIGKDIIVNDQDQSYKVTAVINEVPKNSHFHFDLFATMPKDGIATSNSWTNSYFHTYLVLQKGYDYKQLESKLPQVFQEHMGSQLQEELGVSYAEFTKENQLGLFLQPLTDIHLESDFAAVSELEPGGDIKYIYIFSIVAIFMLLIACINFMNLSTAAASKRAKEIGVKKVMGSGKRHLIYQFLIESFLATVLAMIFASMILWVSLPLFNALSSKELQLDYLFKPYILVALMAIIIVISLLAGSYPAFYLSSFKPITALKSKFSGPVNTKNIRSGLVIFQFVISAGLIIATLVVDQQMNYIQNKDIGYNKDQMLVLRNTYLLNHNENAFKDQILKDARIANVTHSAFAPAGPTDNEMSGIFLGDTFQRRMFVYNIDERYIATMGMELVSGRNFSKEFGNEANNVIINERAAKVLGFDENAIEKTFIRDTNQGKQTLTIVGVIKDFHFKSLHKTIEPLIMLYNPYGGLIVRAKTSDMSGIIATVEHNWNQLSTSEPLHYSLLDEAYNLTYIKEQKMGIILRVFALLTIFVACLGLFGLVTFTAEQRFKEIGIRKVLGSSVSQIIAMLSTDFLKPIGVSFLIAFPLGFYVMNKWLEDFAYRIEISWWIFILAGTITMIIAFLTIGWKSYRAASMNPVNSLRTE
ncbi:ABC transporter permease [Aquimarina sp. 2304DJ70-9]|uniref:ABC transporter permease n=1 Tax=Aquimarina penaris TaxID=3231044 RepID=UPI003462E910